LAVLILTINGHSSFFPDLREESAHYRVSFIGEAALTRIGAAQEEKQIKQKLVSPKNFILCYTVIKFNCSLGSWVLAVMTLFLTHYSFHLILELVAIVSLNFLRAKQSF